MNNTKGLILISVLIFINLIVLLVTIGFTASELQMRMSSNQLQQAQILQTARFGLKTAYQALKQHPPACQIPVCSSYELAKQPVSWWHSGVTCHGKFMRENYYYVVEQLTGKDQYWRITVRAEQAVKDGAAVILQATFALSGQVDCLQSWRQLR